MENVVKAVTEKTLFSRTTSIQKHIHTDPETLWSILVDGEKYTKWNSTITHFDGQIKKGATIRLKSYLDEKRTFKLKVKELIEGEKLVWGDGMGKRTFDLKANDSGTLFSMSEKIGGPFFPLFAKMIPSFDEAFEKFVNDLENEAIAIEIKN